MTISIIQRCSNVSTRLRGGLTLLHPSLLPLIKAQFDLNGKKVDVFQTKRV